MAVRAKFMCQSKVDNGEGFEVVFHPVYGGSPENEKFFKYTPAGYVSLSTINKAAADQFIEGKEYYVDFTPAE